MTRLRYSSRSGRGNLAGEVAANGDVYAQNDLGRRFVGRIDAEGRVWDATENNVGSVASDNQIYDINGRIVGFTTPEGETRVGAGIAGYVEGTDLWRGGAALLLLLKAVPLTPPSPAVQTSPKNKTASLTQALTAGAVIVVGIAVIVVFSTARNSSVPSAATPNAAIAQDVPLPVATGELSNTVSAAVSEEATKPEIAVQNEIEEQVRRSAEAFTRQDVSGLLAYATPDWQFIAEDGRADSLADSRKYYESVFLNRANKPRSERTVRLEKTVVNVTLNDPKNATVLVQVTVERGDGKQRMFGQYEEWTQTANGWRCRRERRQAE
jgi:ketosteroid isomerase-like protein